jgi:hypothetical protein
VAYFLSKMLGVKARRAEAISPKWRQSVRKRCSLSMRDTSGRPDPCGRAQIQKMILPALIFIAIGAVTL